jgi:hypothetical protein
VHLCAPAAFIGAVLDYAIPAVPSEATQSALEVPVDSDSSDSMTTSFLLFKVAMMAEIGFNARAEEVDLLPDSYESAR